MPSPPFYLQLADADGVIIRTRCGGKQEADLIESIVRKVLEKGVGFFKTSNHVENDLREGIKDAILAIKVKDPFDVEP